MPKFNRINSVKLSLFRESTIVCPLVNVWVYTLCILPFSWKLVANENAKPKPLNKNGQLAAQVQPNNGVCGFCVHFKFASKWLLTFYYMHLCNCVVFCWFPLDVFRHKFLLFAFVVFFFHFFHSICIVVPLPFRSFDQKVSSLSSGFKQKIPLEMHSTFVWQTF